MRLRLAKKIFQCIPSRYSQEKQDVAVRRLLRTKTWKDRLVELERMIVVMDKLMKEDRK